MLFLADQDRWIGAARTFAFGAALVVVAVTLLPEAVAALGLWALGIALLAYLVPVAFDALRHRSTVAAASTGLGFELGFAAVWLHQAFDGLQMGAVDHTLGPGVVLAIATHGAPLVAAAVLASSRTEGRRRALARGGVLLVGTCVGVALGNALPVDLVDGAGPLMRAAIAGLLLHVVTHDLADAAPRDTAGRLADAVAFVVGVSLPWLLLHSAPAHDHGGPALPTDGRALLCIALAGLWLAWAWPHGVRGTLARWRHGTFRRQD